MVLVSYPEIPVFINLVLGKTLPPLLGAFSRERVPEMKKKLLELGQLEPDAKLTKTALYDKVQRYYAANGGSGEREELFAVVGISLQPETNWYCTVSRKLSVSVSNRKERAPLSLRNHWCLSGSTSPLPMALHLK